MKNDLKNMLSLDLFFSGLNDGKNQFAFSEEKNSSMPLLSWDFFSLINSERLENLKLSKDIETVKAIAKKHRWENDINTIFKENDFEALVITDIDQKIVWVNDGFSKMTGYPKRFAMNKNPKFLQGKQTSEASKNEIKRNLKRSQPFRKVITNYKKDGTEYKCELKVFPLYTDKTTHFIALEKQVV
ncbi:PAS domain-containing protein [Galbibacter sp. BG1]|uniref:PAS domain-containing protein n=1 Tax=Galbibacter sp. BG1 TaxID=1170699 RepID=UPI0015B86AA4|nr:PAS domain-containing protein [Galbibacter sp. BG1]QLE00262.1 PAS domain-containing protein [Galbibacter sp. BG1]